jgi:glyoxylase-like metal-dependent hydrolase (beta-lactamase superfamily II)
VQKAVRALPHGSIGHVLPLVQRGDAIAVATPGHVVGHQGVVTNLDDSQHLLVADAVLDDALAAGFKIPASVRQTTATLQTDDMLRRARPRNPTLALSYPGSDQCGGNGCLSAKGLIPQH